MIFLEIYRYIKYIKYLHFSLLHKKLDQSLKCDLNCLNININEIIKIDIFLSKIFKNFWKKK